MCLLMVFLERSDDFKLDSKSINNLSLIFLIFLHFSSYCLYSSINGTLSLPTRKRLKPGDKVLLSLMDGQVGLIIEHIPIGENLLATLYHSKVWDNIVKVRCTLDELSQLASGIKVYKTTDAELQQNLDAILDAIAEVEQRYWVRPRLAIVPRPT
jgi:hypothetical protein